MSARDITLRIVATVLWTVAIFEILGGQFVWRQALPGGATQTSALTIYRGFLAPPPPGPQACDLADAGVYALTMPCDWRPPFIAVAKKYL